MGLGDDNSTAQLSLFYFLSPFSVFFFILLFIWLEKTKIKLS